MSCCYDLAQGGFSFFLDEKPIFERLVARFHLTESIYISARVVHWRPAVVDGWGGIIEPGTQSVGAISTAGRNESKFLVGCQFHAAVRALSMLLLPRPGQCIIESLPVGVLKGFLGICLVDRAMSRIVALMIICASLCRPAASPVHAADHGYMVPAGEAAEDADARYEQVELPQPFPLRRPDRIRR